MLYNLDTKIISKKFKNNFCKIKGRNKIIKNISEKFPCGEL
jgi:hypothetical protein